MSVRGDDDTVAGSGPGTSDTGPGTSDIGPSTSPPPLGEGDELIAGRYQIVRWLGGGGMGRVYEALDTELDERVALKVLSSGLAEEAIERFRREVKLTRRIVHRNVARMFDIGEHGGERFLTMELVDGEPLSRTVRPPVPWPNLRAITEQLCAGLAAAHATGIVHRDLKPDNVLVERGSGRIVITDFGIARGGDDPGVTQAGAVVGTPRYMAPEQLAGREVDARADLFSLGVMLFELATGTRPWAGDTAIAIAVAQATIPRRALVTATTDIPVVFATIVGACLDIEPERRPARAELVAQAIATGDAEALQVMTRAERANRPSVAPAPASSSVSASSRATELHAPTLPIGSTALAVLPIACAPGDDYLADGVQEELTDLLSTTKGLRVRPSGVARAQAQDPRELGRQLAVDQVVVGSLRRSGGNLRVAARLIGVADGFQIWAHKVECVESEVLQASAELARGIATALSTHATAVTRQIDPRAVDLYLRARAELRRFWANHAQAATELLERAAEYAPSSAPILGALAWASVQTWILRGIPELRAQAERALERGLATGHGEAHLAAAQYAFNRGEPERGARELATALVRTPMSAQVHELAGKILVEVIGAVEARYHFETALGLDPSRGPIIGAELARLEALEGKWESAIARVAALLADPDPSLSQLGSLFRTRLGAWRGDPAGLRIEGPKFAPRLGDRALHVLEFVFHADATGTFDRVRWRELVGEIASPDIPLRTQLVGLQFLAETAAATGEVEASLETLAIAAQCGLIDIVWLDRCPLFAPIAARDGFAAVRQQVDARARAVLAAFRSVAAG
ncbi:MAG TPA: protein kinase [Kofleriaceae bacterium]|jgi:serine/threonine-protein kinase